MLRRIGYTEPIPGTMDFDESIVGLHYIHGSLEHIDPFGEDRIGRIYRWWKFEESDEDPEPWMLGQVWTLEEQLFAAIPEPKNEDDLVIMPTCPNEIARSQHASGIPAYWSDELNVAMHASRMILLRTPASRIMNGAPELYTHWSGNPAVSKTSESDMDGVLSGGHTAPTPRQCKQAAQRWFHKFRCRGFCDDDLHCRVLRAAGTITG